MKALTLWRPWPWAIFHAGARRKLIENRPRPCPQGLVGTGHPLLLHAGKHWDAAGAQFIQRTLGLTGLPEAAWQEGLIGKTLIMSVARSVEEVPEEQRGWWLGPVAMVLHGPATVAFPTPIRFSGKQGYFELDVETSNKVSDVLLAMDRNRGAA